jgi:hypothetical protein
MKVLMVHEIEDWMLELDLSFFDVITFDDGLFSQFKHHKHFLKFNKPLFFFISSDIVCEGEQNEDLISCSGAHKKYFEKNLKENYMTWEQITIIYNTPNCFIGGHSHTHPNLRNESIKNQVITAKKEVELMLETFNSKNISISSFAYPYNDEIIGYKQNLESFITFGDERIPIEKFKGKK